MLSLPFFNIKINVAIKTFFYSWHHNVILNFSHCPPGLLVWTDIFPQGDPALRVQGSLSLQCQSRRQRKGCAPTGCCSATHSVIIQGSRHTRRRGHRHPWRVVGLFLCQQNWALLKDLVDYLFQWKYKSCCVHKEKDEIFIYIYIRGKYTCVFFLWVNFLNKHLKECIKNIYLFFNFNENNFYLPPESI